MSDVAIQTRALRREYAPRRGPARVALDGIDLRIRAGEIHGLLGPNGAGKTTLVKILSTVLLPTSGSVEVLGFDVAARPREVRTRIGSVFGGERGLYARVSSRRNLLFWASLYGLHGAKAKARCEELMERVGLAERANDPVEQLSRGMMQRLHLARGLIGDPRVLFLDEPTTGLDPAAAKGFRDIVSQLAAEGRTILLTTHDLAEAEALCASISVIDRGRMLMASGVREVGLKLAAVDRIAFETHDARVVAKIKALPGVDELIELDVQGRFRAQPSSPQALHEAIKLLAAEGVSSINTSPPSLEEVYLHLTGERGLAL
jgi:ABC-2 type transport system ATP-binding protein